MQTGPLFTTDVAEAMPAVASNVITRLSQLHRSAANTTLLVALLIRRLLELLLVIGLRTLMLQFTSNEQLLAANARLCTTIAILANSVHDPGIRIRNVSLGVEKFGALRTTAIYAVPRLVSISLQQDIMNTYLARTA